MEADTEGNTIYKAMQVEDNGILCDRYGFTSNFRSTARYIVLGDNCFRRLSSYDQTLFIGNGGAHPKLAEIYVRLHELLARIFKLRGQPGYYQHNLDVDDE